MVVGECESRVFEAMQSIDLACIVRQSNDGILGIKGGEENLVDSNDEAAS